MRRFSRLQIFLFATALVATGCGQQHQPAGSTEPSRAAQPVQSGASDARAAFEAAQRQAEQQRQLERELTERRRGFVEAAFREIDEQGRVVVAITNLTDKSIDDIRGGFWVFDAEGNYLSGSGYTEAVPGSVFLDAGQTKTLMPSWASRPEVLAALRDNPQSVRFAFEAQAVTYADGTTEPGLDG